MERAKRYLTPRNLLIAGGVLAVPAILLGVMNATSDGNTRNAILPSQPELGIGGGGGLDAGDTNPLLEPTVTPNMMQGWSCKKINNPDWSSYNPSLPTVRNAFRAVGLAGKPNVWESGPYLHIDNGGGKKFGDSWDAFSETYNGEQVCVRVDTQSRLPQHQVVFRETRTKQVVISTRVREQFRKSTLARTQSFRRG